MEVIGKQVHEEKTGGTVEFVGEGGDFVSVHMKKDDDGNLNRLNAEEKAKAVMVQIATSDTDIEEPDETPVEFVAGKEPSPSGTAPPLIPATGTFLLPSFP